MSSWKAKAALLFFLMLALMMSGLYSVHRTMERTTLCTNYDFLKLRWERGLVELSLFGLEKSFETGGVAGMKEFLRDVLKIEWRQE